MRWDGSVTRSCYSVRPVLPCAQVPVSGVEAALPTSNASLDTHGSHVTVDVIRETDELKKARLAWILGRRCKTRPGDITMTVGDGIPYENDVHWDAGKGVNRSSRLCSTEYLSRLFELRLKYSCIQLSLRYDSESMGGKPDVGGAILFPNYSGGLLGTVSRPMKVEGTCTSKGPVGKGGNSEAFYRAAIDYDRVSGTAAALGVTKADHPLQVPLHRSASMTFTNNITFDVATRHMGTSTAPAQDVSSAEESQAARSIDNRKEGSNVCIVEKPDRDFKCGIYPRSLSPFLHGRTLLQGMSATSLDSEKCYPHRMPDALGDHVAFAALDEAMTRKGILDWRPDGVVNSKLENGPDAESDAQYDAKDGQLFNVHVQGPAICSNWCGSEHSRSLVAGDKLFVAVVADCWVNCGNKEGFEPKHLPYELQQVHGRPPSALSADMQKAADDVRSDILKSFHKTPRPVDLGNRKVSTAAELHYSKLFGLQEMNVATVPDASECSYQPDAGVGLNSCKSYDDNTVKPHLLCNFRLKYVTSSQMVETSKLQLDDEGGVSMGPNGRWLEGSRLGLAFSRVQLREGQPYDADMDAWLDPDNTEEAATYAGFTESQVNDALKLHSENPDVVRGLEPAFTQQYRTGRVAVQAGLKKEATEEEIGDGRANLARPPPYNVPEEEVERYVERIVALEAAAESARRTRAEAMNAFESAQEALIQAVADEKNKHTDAELRQRIDLYAEIRERFRGPKAGAALHEVVVGAWHVGTVLDTAASRGAGRGFASHKYDSCVNLNVDVQWWTGDRLYKNYANRPGTGKDFRMRGMPAMGSTTNANKHSLGAPAFYPRRDVGVDGSSVTDNGSVGYYVKMELMGQISGDAADEIASSIMEARTTFPDPWDLPAAVPMLVDRSSSSSTYDNLMRDQYVSVGRQRGTWYADHPTRSRRHVPSTEGVLVTDLGNKLHSRKEYELMSGTPFEGPDAMDYLADIVANTPN